MTCITVQLVTNIICDRLDYRHVKHVLQERNGRCAPLTIIIGITHSLQYTPKLPLKSIPWFKLSSKPGLATMFVSKFNPLSTADARDGSVHHSNSSTATLSACGPSENSSMIEPEETPGLNSYKGPG